jgi:hypothetical protein
MKNSKRTWPAAFFAPLAACALFAACANMDAKFSGAGEWEWRRVDSESTVPLYPGRQEKGPAMRLTWRLLDLGGAGKGGRALRDLLYDGGTPEIYRDKSGEALRNEYLDRGKIAEANPGMAGEFLNWSYAETVECGAESPGYAVLRRVRESYLGGAHGMRETAYFLIGRDGGRISLDRIIKEDAGPALARLVKEGVRRYFDLAEGRPLTDVLFDGDFETPDNFFPGPGGLGFHWDPYEIAPYSAGPVELSIPWAQCADLLSGEGLQIAADFGFL